MEARRRTSERAAAGALRLLLAGSLAGALALFLGGPASAAPFAATASVTPNVQYLGDKAGTVFAFTITNTGTSSTIGAVQITRPGSAWTVTGCPLAPPGWSASRSITMCRYTSATGTGDDVPANGGTATIEVKATTDGGSADRTGSWGVVVSQTNRFDNPSLLTPAAAAGSLDVAVHSFQVLDAVVVAAAPTAAGSNCPSGDRSAVAGATGRTVVICGRNRTNRTLTPLAAYASLGGTFVAGSGTFTSGPVAKSAANADVVLGWWTGVVVTSSSGTGRTVAAEVGSAANQTSPLTTLPGYEAVNPPPVAHPQSPGTLEDTPRPITLTGSDPEDQPLTFGIVAAPTNGSLGAVGAPDCSGTNTCTASVTYTPNANFSGSDSFTFAVSDGAASSAPATVSVAVTAVNDAPSFTAGGDVGVLEDSGAYSAAWATAISKGPADESGQTLAFHVTGNTSAALFSAGPAVSPGGALSFTPAADANGSADVTVELRDDGGTAGGGDDTSAAVTFRITVTAVNDAPTFTTGGDVGVLEDSGAYSAAWATAIGKGPADESGQTLAFHVTGNTNPTLFSAAPSVSPGGALSFTPAAHANGSADVTVELRDNGGTSGGGDDTSAAVTFRITVTAVNDEPTFTLPASPDQTVVQDLGAQTVTGFATGISAGPANESAQALTFHVSNDNTALFTTAGQPDVDEATGNLTYRSATGATGSATVSVHLSDDGGTAGGGDDTSATRTFTISVVPPNARPTDITLTPSSVAENNTPPTAVGTLTTADADAGDTHTYSLVSGTGDGDNGSFSITGGQLSITVAADHEAKSSYSIRIRTDDGKASGTFEEAITVSVANVNEAPTDISLSPSGINENNAPGATVGTLSATDPDASETHTFTKVAGTGDTDNGAFTITGSALTINGAADFENKSSYSIRVRVTDAGSSTFEEQLTVTVTNLNEAPTDISLSPSGINENNAPGATVGTLSATDPDASETHTFAKVAGTGDTDNGAFTITGTTLTINGAADFENKASYSIRVRVTDAGSSTFEEQLTVTVSNVNETPDAVADAQTFSEDGPAAAILVRANDSDPDGNPLTVTAVNTAGTTGSVTITNSGADVTYNPNGQFDGLQVGQTAQTTFTYTVSDGSLTDTATVTVTIQGVNDNPVAVTDTFTGAVGNTKFAVGVTVTGEPVVSVAGSLLANDTDVDNPMATAAASFESAPTGAAVTVNADGSFTYVSPPGFTGSGSFQYRVTDANGGSAVGTVNVAVGNVVWYVRNNAAAGGTGTSVAPFDTLVEGEAASGNGHTVFVYDGDNTSAGYGGDGYQMNSGERLIGEHEGLTVGATTLLAANPGAHPTLTATDADVVSLDDGNEVRGLTIDPGGAGGGIAGASGDTGGGTIDDVNVVDAATFGTQPGIELDATAGTFNVSNLVVSTTGATGVRLNGAGTVVFNPAGQISLTTAGARALDAVSTALGTSTFDDVTVTGAASAGVVMTGTTGTIALGDEVGTDLSLTTTAGSGLVLGNAGTVTVGAGGTDTIAATGGPAVNVNGAASLDFDDVDSTNSPSTGVSLTGFGTGTFNAPAGSAISGSTTTGFNVDGGSGAVTFGGTVTNTAGRSVSVANRTGGTVDLNGAVTATGGTGVLLNANGAGLVRFDGGLSLSTGANAAFTATGSGNVAVTDPNATGVAPDNTLTTTTGVALNVASVNIHADGLKFRSITAGTGASGPSSGIILNATGPSGGLTVSGAGTAGSGGTIQETTGDAVSLTGTRNVSLSRMNVQNNLGSGINGSGVTDFALADSTVSGNGDDAVTDEAGVRFTNLAGTASVTASTFNDNMEDNFRVINTSGTLSQLTISGSTFSRTAAASPGNNGVLIQADGGSITADLTANQFLRNYANGVQVVTNGSGSVDVEVGTATAGSGGTYTDNNIGVNIAHNSTATLAFDVRNISLTSAGRTAPTAASPINLNLGACATNLMSGTVADNSLNNANSLTGPGIRVVSNGPVPSAGCPGPAGTMTVNISGNTISQVANFGIQVLARDGSSTINATIRNNTITLTDPAALDAIRMDSAAASTDATTVCADVGANSATTIAGQFGIRVRQRFAGTTFRLEGYSGAPTDTAAVAAYLNARNTTVSPAASADAGGVGFGTVANCPEPV